jgi:aspartate 1-decarboxylase
MMRILMKSKIHNATVTEANLNYTGSITIDEELMKQADIVEGERVQIVNLNNGERLETYTIVGKKCSGIICMNGPAALKCKKGDRIHIITYVIATDEDRKKLFEKVIILDEKNKIKKEIPESDENKAYSN